MSHTSIMQDKITNINLFCRIAKDGGHEVKQAAKGTLMRVNHYGSNGVDNAVAEVKLKDWRYPLAITEDGSIMYDHFGSAPASMQTFRDTKQQYNKELIESGIPFDQLSNWTTKKVANGDIIIELEY